MHVITKFNFNKTAAGTPDSSTATATTVQVLRTALISVTCTRYDVIFDFSYWICL